VQTVGGDGGGNDSIHSLLTGRNGQKTKGFVDQRWGSCIQGEHMTSRVLVLQVGNESYLTCTVLFPPLPSL
jgi:hypothetical protein